MSELPPDSEQEPSQRDVALLFLCKNGWANRHTGADEPHLGEAWAVSNDERDVASLLDVLNDTLPLDSPSDLVGHYLVTELNGATSVAEFASEAALQSEYNEYKWDYERWLDS